MTSASATDPPDAGPEPYQIGLRRQLELRHRFELRRRLQLRRRRLELRRRGREDGHDAIPDPHTDVAPLTTAAREQLRSVLAIQVSELWEIHWAGESHPEMLKIDLKLPTLRQAVEKANREVEAFDPSNVVLSLGEQNQGRSREFVIGRRLRALEDRLKSAVRELERTEERLAELAAPDENRRKLVVFTEHQLIATFEYERTIYDRALLSRHPLRDLVRPMLDCSVPEMSPWACAQPRMNTGDGQAQPRANVGEE